MRMAFAAAGLVVVAGIGGAYALLGSKPAPPKAATVVRTTPEIPKAETARLFALSAQSSDITPNKTGAALVPKTAAPIKSLPKANATAVGKKAKTVAKPMKAKAKGARSKQAAKAKSA